MRARVDRYGRFVVPVEIRKKLGIKPEDTLILEVKGRELRMMTLRERIARVQAEMRKYVAPGRSLSQELIAERRVEARREEKEVLEWRRRQSTSRSAGMNKKRS